MDGAEGELRFVLDYAICVKFGVNFFFAVEVKFQHTQNLLLGWNSHDLKMRKPHNRCILHRLPTILWNWSGFHKLQHSTTCLWNLLEKLWQNHPQIVLTGYFFHHVFGHSSLAFWAWYVTLSWPSSQSTLVFQF